MGLPRFRLLKSERGEYAPSYASVRPAAALNVPNMYASRAGGAPERVFQHVSPRLRVVQN